MRSHVHESSVDGFRDGSGESLLDTVDDLTSDCVLDHASDQVIEPPASRSSPAWISYGMTHAPLPST